MASGLRQIRVACRRCNHDAVRTLKAGDKRSLKKLRQTARCGNCYALAAKGWLLIQKMPRRRPPQRAGRFAPVLAVEHPAGSSHVADRTVDWTEMAVAICRGVGSALAWGVISAAVLSIAATGLLAVMLAANVVSWFAGALVDAAAFDQSRARGADYQCEAKLHYMDVNGPQDAWARELAYDQLAANCGKMGGRVAELRYRDRQLSLLSSSQPGVPAISPPAQP